jgi:hypothetical protein
MNNLNPDTNYEIPLGSANIQFENEISDTANFLTVNAYDKFPNTGVFSSISLPPIFVNQLQPRGQLVATAYRDKVGDPWNYKVYGYDYLGRINNYWIKDSKLNNWKTIHNYYDNLNHLTKQNINDEFYYFYEYDNQGRLINSKSNLTDNLSN